MFINSSPFLSLKSKNHAMTCNHLDQKNVLLICNSVAKMPTISIKSIDKTENSKLQKQVARRPRNQLRVSVVYYLTQNGKLELPHIMEVPVSTPQGLQLKDVINTFELLRGQGTASMYSWSSKREYGKGFVWQDLLEDDFIYTCDDDEYILKGSLLIDSIYKEAEKEVEKEVCISFSKRKRGMKNYVSPAPEYRTPERNDDPVAGQSPKPSLMMKCFGCGSRKFQ